TVGELEKMLGVNPALETPRDVARGGLRNSGIALNNRVVERHIARYGAYWRSYDFRGSQGEQNIFRDPVTLHANGGEFIFSLPNGMQGYFIADAEGRRLDKAPIDIVA